MLPPAPVSVVKERIKGVYLRHALAGLEYVHVEGRPAVFVNAVLVRMFSAMSRAHDMPRRTELMTDMLTDRHGLEQLCTRVETWRWHDAATASEQSALTLSSPTYNMIKGTTLLLRAIFHQRRNLVRLEYDRYGHRVHVCLQPLTKWTWVLSVSASMAMSTDTYRIVIGDMCTHLAGVWQMVAPRNAAASLWMLEHVTAMEDATVVFREFMLPTVWALVQHGMRVDKIVSELGCDK